METPSPHTLRSDPQVPSALAYSSAALAAWIFRKPILALAGFIIHLALALVKPALLVLGAVQLSHWLQASRKDSTHNDASQHPGDDEALLVPARSLSPTSGLEV